MTITLETTWTDYLESHNLKSKTERDHYSKLIRCVPDWMDLDMNTISKTMIEKRHKKLSNKPTQANCVFRIIRALYNYAINTYEDEKEEPLIKRNPVIRLSQSRLWNKEYPRQRMIPIKKLGVWTDAVVTLTSTTIGDYLLTLVTTGLRKEECATLEWKNIDLDNRFLLAPNTKNGKPHQLPLSRFLYALFLRRREEEQRNKYVFDGGRSGGIGHLESPYKAIAKIREATGIPFSPHDLRRTFNKMAEKCGIEESMRKRLLNHTPQDVTGKHYSVPDPEEWREPMEKISMFFLESSSLLTT